VPTDPADPRLADYARLTDVALRRRLEVEHGLFLAEGGTVVRRCLELGYTPRSLLLLDTRAAEEAGLAEAVRAAGAPVLVAGAEVLEAATGFDVHRGVLASFERRVLPTIGEVVAGGRLVAVLEGLTDHTNVGAVFRSAAALGVDAVVLDPRCADPLYRRAVRTSMGATLALPYARADAWPHALHMLRDAGFELLALTPSGDVGLDALPVATGPRAVLLGTEGTGLSRHALAAADLQVSIPMALGTDSLNVAAAAAVAFWALRPTAGG
jgi:tRNA G18 (ribose-2'-O)-methylase SpoU